jgi:8-oxo-dGTP diphosphatase
MSFAIEYVLGFAFTPEGSVALIEKARPVWQAGRLNGIGGHREQGETAVMAMAREFKEEAGLTIEPAKWRRVGFMRCDEKWRCTVFTTTDERIRHIKTRTDEKVMLLAPFECTMLREKLLANVPSLLELCRMPLDHTKTVPLFHLDYTNET